MTDLREDMKALLHDKIDKILKDYYFIGAADDFKDTEDYVEECLDFMLEIEKNLLSKD